MFTFNAADHDPSAGIVPIPAGDYHVCIRKSNIKGTQSGTGGMLMLNYEVLTEGPVKGKTAFNSLNLWNPSQEAVEIANKEMSAICHATGVQNVQGSQQPDMAVAMLHDKPFLVAIGIRQDRNGNPRNTFSNYRTAQGAALTRGNFSGTGPAGPGPVPGHAPQMPGQMPQGGPAMPPQGQFPGAAPMGAPGMAAPPPGQFQPQGGAMPGQPPFPGAPQAGGFPGAPGAAPQPQGFPGASQGGFPGQGAPQGGFQPPQGQPGAFPGAPAAGGFPGAPQGQPPQQGFPGAPQQGFAPQGGVQQPWGPQG